jgi:aldose 1-epimerase
VFVTATEAGVEFSLTSADGDEGYPGTLRATATYTLTAANELKMVFEATTDAATVE